MRGLKHVKIYAFILIIIVTIYMIVTNKPSKDVNLGFILNVALKAAENGGKEILKVKNLNVMSKGKTKEGLQDSVTTADIQSHCSMLSLIEKHYPSIQIISEEKVICNKSDDNFHVKLEDFGVFDDEWVKENDIKIWIDPLDATYEFIEGLYKYVTTMVCITVKGNPIIGVIHKPFENITSWAWIGKEARSQDLYFNKNVNSLNRTKERIIISRSHRGEIENVISEKLKKPYEIIVAAGAGYKTLEVAKNNADVYLHQTAIKKWDICAGDAILRALGGKMTDKYNNPIDYSDDINIVNENGLIATLKNHFEFLNILQ